MMSSTLLTVVQIPCCVCGTLILPNAANQCGTCLAQECDLRGALGGNGPLPEIKQCRQCRRFQRKPKMWQDLDMESPQLLSLCLHILQPAMSAMKLVDALWVWTEPHSMRLKLRLTVRQVVLETTIEQRILVEFRIVWEQCPDCNREFTNRTWHAVVQVRQKRDTSTSGNLSTDGPKTGLAALEMALAKNADVRKHVIRMDTKRQGFDFYFLQLHEAQYFSQFLVKLAPMRVKTSSTKLVSTNVKDNTANLQHALVCDLVPMQRHDLVLVHKGANFALQGRLALVDRLTSVVHLLDAAPTMIHGNNSNNANNVVAMAELTPDAYYKNEKNYQLLLSSQRMVPFVVLDVELHLEQPQFHRSRQGPSTCVDQADDASELVVEKQPRQTSGPPKYALADVVVARQSDFGVNDQTFDCITHLGHLLQAGDVVMGYDLSNWVASGGAEWNIQASLPATYQIPPVVLVRKEHATKVKEGVDGGRSETLPPQKGDERIKGVSKKKLRHQRRHEERKVIELQEAASRMGFTPQQDNNRNAQIESDGDDCDEDNKQKKRDAQIESDGGDGDDELEADLLAAENELAGAEAQEN